MKALIAIGVAVTASVAALATTNPAPVPATAGGAVAGTITWDGDLPEPKPALDISDEKAKGCCADGSKVDTTNRSLRVSKDGGVADIVVTLEPKGHKVDVKVPEQPFLMDQHKCHFEPHILVVPQGAKVVYKNSDTISHNVHTISRKNPAFNENVAAGDSKEKLVEHAEVVEVTCDVHPWMSSKVVVTDAPYSGISGADGKVVIEGVAPGTYKVSWWHEELGKGKLDDITVAEGARATFETKVKAEKGGGGGRGRRR